MNDRCFGRDCREVIREMHPDNAGQLAAKPGGGATETAQAEAAEPAKKPKPAVEGSDIISDRTGDKGS